MDDEWTLDRNGRLTRGALAVALSPSQIARLAKVEALGSLERELAVHVGAPRLRENLGNEATAHDVSLYQLQEVLRAWRRWSAERDELDDSAAFLSDGVYAVRLTAEDIDSVVNAPLIADVQTALERLASRGRTGRDDLRTAFERDDRSPTAQLREIQAVVTEFANAPPPVDADE